MTKVSIAQYRAIESAFGINSYVNRNVTISELTSDFEQPKKYGVNWSALGTVDAERANEFMQELNRALELVKILNEAEIVVDWSNEGTREDFTCLKKRLLKKIAEAK